MNLSAKQVKKKDLYKTYATLNMVDPDIEDEVWVSLSVRGKLVSFSSLGRFQDANGINKEVVPAKDTKYIRTVTSFLIC